MKYKALEYSKLNTYSLSERKSKVNVENFYKPEEDDFLKSLPSILAAQDLKDILSACLTALKKKKKIVISMGAHPIKVGLSPLFIELMRKKIISHIAVNGACIIHDVEIAIGGATSEDVAESLKTGSFGMSEETGKFINQAIERGYRKNLGLGEAIGEWLNEIEPKFKDYSIFYNAYKMDIPITVHVAIGTDIIHMHPEANGEAIGSTTLKDFKIFSNTVKDLEEGVYFNIGSAVVMPEVFLKALTLVRNLGYKVKNFTAVNMDFIKHYRPTENVIKRPTLEGGKGYTIIGHHEIMIPLLFGTLLKMI